jgi:hypothetical protein
MKPIAWYDSTNGMVSRDKDSPLFTPLGQVLPLYPQRTWVELTDDELFKIWMGAPAETEDRFAFVNAVISKLKEKNS